MLVLQPVILRKMPKCAEVRACL